MNPGSKSKAKILLPNSDIILKTNINHMINLRNCRNLIQLKNLLQHQQYYACSKITLSVMLFIIFSLLFLPLAYKRIITD
ncbi:hypothetical protein CICLE_v10033228mg [Citrus x clementina]|uniref:Uncharacterized protein n=2 Tax=Citrus TaxID=2706 RepID=A0A067E7H4_CITSI|nr:hypothetical protein CICLE_v10033228mg [Citrus x clementina]KDO51139.1 hypothetical protein CISIN_1g034914mg [Citrus sinensis]